MLKKIKSLNLFYFLNIFSSLLFFTIYFSFNAEKWLFNTDLNTINSSSWKYILLLTLFIVFLICLLAYLIYSSVFFIKNFYNENETKYNLWIRIMMFVTYVFLPPLLLIFSIDNIDNYFINLSNSVRERERERHWKGKVVFLLAIIILIPIQIFTYTIPFIFTKQINKPLIQNSYLELTDTGKNVIVIYLDGVSGLAFNRVMNENSKYKSALDGFTTYVKAITLGSKTSTSNPSIVGGFEFSPKYWENSLITQEKFFHNSFEKHIRMLKSNNYHNITFNSMPYYGKSKYWWHGDINKFNENFKEYNIKSSSNRELYPQYENNIPDAYVLKDLNKLVKINNKDENYYNLSFFQNTHANFTFGNPIVENKNLNVTNYYKAITWSMDQLINFFEYLKVHNSYDNSMIVLLSDHGERFFGNNGPNVNDKDLQSSIMMAIKPFNKRNKLIFDTQKLVTNADLIQIINKSIGNNFNLELDKFNKFGYLSDPLIDDTTLRELFFKITDDWKYYPDKIGQNNGTYRSIFNHWLTII